MAGLFGIDLNKPEVMQAIQLMTARQGELGGLLSNFAQQNEKRKQQQLQEEMQRQQMEAQRMQMDEQKRLMGVRQSMMEAAQRNMTPGLPQMQPTDYETPSGPAGPGGFNLQGYATDLMKAGPEGVEKGIGLLSSLRAQNAPIKVGKDDRLLRPGTYEQILGPAPGDVWEDLGRDPKTGQHMQRNKTTGQLKAAGSMPTQITNVTKLPEPEKAILKADSDRLDEFSSASGQWRRIHQSAAVISNALKGSGGGGMVKIGTETARFLGFKGDTISANDLSESLNTMLATQVRAPGSGSTSNMEFEAYKTAAPSLKNSEEGRALMVLGAKKFADRNAKLADYARVLIRSGRYSDAAMAEHDEKLGPILDDDFRKRAARATGLADPLGIRQ